MAPNYLSALSNELIYLILGYLDDLTDLYCAIRASSHIYRTVFRGSEAIILSNTLKNAICKPVLPDALLSIHPLKLRLKSHPNPDRSRAWTFELLRAIRRKREWEDRPALLPQPRQLAHLHLSINHFIMKTSRRFLSTAMWEAERGDRPELVNSRGTAETESSVHLSQTELSRFQRAFYRYQMIQNLVQAPSDDFTEVPEEDISAIFCEYAPWEVEEIGCIHQYILAQLQDLFRQIEDAFIKSVLLTEQKSTSKYLPQGPQEFQHMVSLAAETPFHNEGLFFCLESERQGLESFMEHLASLGLPFLRQLFEADYERRKELILDNYGSKDDSLSSALMNYMPVPPRPIFAGEWNGQKNKIRLEFETDDYHKRNRAWLWANQYHHQCSYFMDRDFDLRAWGYVYWDNDRLNKLGIMKDPRPRYYGHNFPPHYDRPEKFYEEPSAQKRLRDLGYA